MPTFIATERLRVAGIGRVEAGGAFEVDPSQAKRLHKLESKGLIIRHHPTVIHRAAAATIDHLKMLVGYENKAIVPEESRMPAPLNPLIAQGKGGRR